MCTKIMRSFSLKFGHCTFTESLIWAHISACKTQVLKDLYQTNLHAVFSADVQKKALKSANSWFVVFLVVFLEQLSFSKLGHLKLSAPPELFWSCDRFKTKFIGFTRLFTKKILSHRLCLNVIASLLSKTDIFLAWDSPSSFITV
jgi:hypothetical protein